MANLSPVAKSNGLPHEEPILTEFIRPADEDAEATPRPGNIEKFYIEDEYEAAEEEQIKAFARSGESAARGAEEVAAGLEHEATRAISASDAKHYHATNARQRLEEAEGVLGPYSRRSTDAKGLKWLRWALLFAGDVAGIAGAALLLGETVAYASVLAISAAASAITLGAVGREVRFVSTARFRQKDVDQLSEGEQQFASWFAGPNMTESLVKMTTAACATGGILIGSGVFALRYAAEGIEPAIAFGCLALALGLASFYNSFDTADDVAEHLEARAKDVKKLEKAADKARKDAAISTRGKAQAQATSVRAEHKSAGEAAAAAVRRGLYAALGNSPGVAGHGTAKSNARPPGAE